MIRIPADDPSFELWEALLELADILPKHWSLIGAQMVVLHGFERGRVPARVSTDADLIVNTRVVGTSVSSFAETLVTAGYELEGISGQGIGHRFSRGTISLDLLAPDGLGNARRSVETIRPARTVQVPGGSQALKRTELVDVAVGSSKGALPRPNLTGALLVKARAVEVDDVFDAQLVDVAFLLSLVEDPAKLRNELTTTERKWLRRLSGLSALEATPWRSLGREEAEDGFAAYQILTTS